MAAAVHRKSAKELSWNQLLPEITTRVLGLDKATKAILDKGLVDNDGHDEHAGAKREAGMLMDMHDMVYAYLGPGKELEELTVDAVQELVRELDGFARWTLAAAEDGAQTVELLPWIRRLVMQSTSRFFYGSRNPFAMNPDRPDLERGFWDFDHGLGRLLLGIFPSVTASKAYQGRERLVAAFRQYIDQKHYEPPPTSPESGDGDGADRRNERGASPIIFNRLRICAQHGFSTDATARSETSFLFALLVNTASVAFWTIIRIFADPALLTAVRDELQHCEAFEELDQQGRTRLSMGKLVKNNFAACPLLHSVYREVLRVGSNNVGARLVLGGDDTEATPDLAGAGKDYVQLATSQDGQHVLRKGGIVQIAGGAMHANKAIWGDDADDFNPRRHLRNQPSRIPAAEDSDGKKSSAGGSTIHPAAFRSFGGGNTLCPGRHFASAEIVALIACIVLRFDIQSADENKLQVPALDDHIMPVHILEPVAGNPVRVRIRLREKENDMRVEVAL